MNPLDQPFPRTVRALSRLNGKRLEFAHRILAGDFGAVAYRAVYGQDRSRHANKAAAKIKSGRAVSEYLEARYQELCIRDRIQYEVHLDAIRERWSRGEQAQAIEVRIEVARREQLAAMPEKRQRQVARAKRGNVVMPPIIANSPPAHEKQSAVPAAVSVPAALPPPPPPPRPPVDPCLGDLTPEFARWMVAYQLDAARAQYRNREHYLPADVQAALRNP